MALKAVSVRSSVWLGDRLEPRLSVFSYGLRHALSFDREGDFFVFVLKCVTKFRLLTFVRFSFSRLCIAVCTLARMKNHCSFCLVTFTPVCFVRFVRFHSFQKAEKPEKVYFFLVQFCSLRSVTSILVYFMWLKKRPVLAALG